MNSLSKLRTNEIEKIISKKGKLTREEKIILEIKNNPGIRFRELMKSISITNGVMSYYIQKLEKLGIIFTERKNGVSRLFIDGINTADVTLIKFLRTPTPKKIMVALLKDEKLTFRQLIEKIQMSPSTTSFYLKKLVNSNIVHVLNGTNNKYILENKKQVSNLIVLYHPSLIDTASENLEDIFS